MVVPQNGCSIEGGLVEMTEALTPSKQSKRSLSKKNVWDYNPQKKVNMHEFIVIQIND